MEELDLGQLAKLIMEAIQGGNWALVASAALVLVVWGLRKFGGEKIPFLKTDAGGALTVLLMAIFGAGMNLLAGGGVLSWALVATALKVGFTAAGGYSTVKKLLPWVLGLFKKQPIPAPVESLPTPVPTQQAEVDAKLLELGYQKQADGTYLNLTLVKPKDPQ